MRKSADASNQALMLPLVQVACKARPAISAEPVSAQYAPAFFDRWGSHIHEGLAVTGDADGAASLSHRFEDFTTLRAKHRDRDLFHSTDTSSAPVPKLLRRSVCCERRVR